MSHFPWELAGMVAKYMVKRASSLGGNSRKVPHIITPVVGKFSTRNGAFQDEIKEVVKTIKRYVQRKSHGRPLNVVLSASPGGGKSFLAEQIAGVAGGNKAEYQNVYVPSLARVIDLDSIFAKLGKIVAAKKIPFVFFDEMDVDVAGHHFYGNFLGPIWDGKLRYGGRNVSLRPAVFFFAGSSAFPALSEAGMRQLGRFETRPISYDAYRNRIIQELEQRLEGTNSPKKLKDFVDRIDLFICIPPTNQALMTVDDVSKEYLDMVCVMVSKYFRKVKAIEESAILSLSEELSINASRRAVERLLQVSSCPEDSTEFKFSHLPTPVCARYGGAPEIKKAMKVMISFEIRDLT